MPQVTLSVPNEKLPVLKDLLHALGLENNAAVEKKKTSSFQNNLYLG